MTVDQRPVKLALYYPHMALLRVINLSVVISSGTSESDERKHLVAEIISFRTHSASSLLRFTRDLNLIRTIQAYDALGLPCKHLIYSKSF